MFDVAYALASQLQTLGPPHFMFLMGPYHAWRTAGLAPHVLVTMAGAVAVSTGKPGKRYNAKMTGYVWFLCLIGGSGGLLLGYDNGIIGKLKRYCCGSALEELFVSDTSGVLITFQCAFQFAFVHNTCTDLLS